MSAFTDRLERYDALRRELGQRLVGQDYAKDWLARVAVEHEYGVSQKEGSPRVVMLVGDTGSGKTELFRTLSSIMNVPFLRINANELSHTSFRGVQIEDIIDGLRGDTSGLFDFEDDDKAKGVEKISRRKRKLEAASRGIVLVDEIDKIAFRRGGTSDTQERHFEAVQASLLPIFEGKTLDFARDGRSAKKSKFDSSKLLVFAAGAFKDENMAKIIRERVGTSVNLTGGYWENIEHADLSRFGFLPELVGRVRAIVALERFSGRMMGEAFRQILEREGLPGIANKVIAGEEAIDVLASRASDMNIGARGARVILETVSTHVYQRRRGIQVDGDCVTINQEYIAENWPDNEYG